MTALRRLLLAFGLAGALAGSAQTPAASQPVPSMQAAFPDAAGTPLGAEIAALLADPAVARTHWGIAVTTLGGKPIYGLDEGKLFRPASTAKLFTTAAAMALLGPGATVETTVYFRQPAADGIVHGDITLVGHGDANLSGRILPYAGPGSAEAKLPPADPLRYLKELADKVAQAGVRHISGKVVGSDWPWEPYPQGWGTDDLLWGYGAPVSSLAIDDNEVKLTASPGALYGPAQVTLTPDIGYYRVVSTVRTTEADEVGWIAIHREAARQTFYVDGLVRLGHAHSTEIAVDDPPAYAATALLRELEARGITVDGGATAAHEFAGNPDGFLPESKLPVVLSSRTAVVETPGLTASDARKTMQVTHVSPTVSEDVAVTLKDSLNLHAEIMLRRLGEQFGDVFLLQDKGSTFAEGARVVRQWLTDAGIDGDDFIFYDGSGLSTKDLVAPRATAKLLAYARTQPWFATWMAALPVGGVDGSLATRFQDAPLKGHVFAKTGTLGESRALAGYLDCASGRQVIFSIMVDDHTPGNASDRVAMDRIVAAIAAAE